ncbi:hypothetical protein LCGC14_1836820 [marine sediment metagenome]|uniref:Glycosyltransferase 2-like domain-containing protein n=1 Tax=marine sediment metagenome TaxID=412755 RepID=A0A0F9GEK2_9ZZZZ
MRVASLATVVDRVHLLGDVVESLLPQMDRINVYLNGHTELPDCLRKPDVWVAWSRGHGNLGDAGKFFWSGRLRDCYHFTCDDDLVYPPDYATALIAAIERYERRAIVSVHGAVLHEPLKSYFRGRTAYPCLEELTEDHQVDVLGTGVLAYHTSTIHLSIDDFPVANMADIWCAVAAKRRGVPRVVIAHERGWLRYLPPPEGTTIYDRYRASGNDAAQTQILASETPWTFCTRLDVVRER